MFLHSLGVKGRKETVGMSQQDWSQVETYIWTLFILCTR